MMAIRVLMHQHYFIVIAMICLWNPISLIADSCKLLAQVLVVVDLTQSCRYFGVVKCNREIKILFCL